ncbi:hypothetical protein [Oryzifoliimicrobium ureilyticus]|uniref:hypothetical protein n=1 Tax=Oryzifoliimicrobium ureilyticus TaxID=3113724 RepID=UPI0030766800
MATFRLTAAGVNDNRLAAAEKLPCSALRIKDSRLASVSIPPFKAFIENETSYSTLKLAKGI